VNDQTTPQGTQSGTPLGLAIATAVARLRHDLGDATAPIVVVVAAGPNGVLTRRALADHGSFIRVWFDSPENLLRQQLPASFWRDHRPEPPGWRGPVLRRLVATLAETNRLGPHGRLLTGPGWQQPTDSALQRLESHGVDSAALLAAAAATTTVPRHVRDRLTMLSTLLGALEEARAAAGYASPADESRAALGSLDIVGVGADSAVGAALCRGAVVVGDRELPRTVSEFMGAWLATRPVIHVRPPAQGLVPHAPLGMAALMTAMQAPVIDVDTTSMPRALRRVQGQHDARSLDGSTVSGTPHDDSVELARTPDDVREATEAVREVRRAVARGVPLDRIAIALPDGRQRPALEEALARAVLPTTWLVGMAAAELPPARLLALAVEVALDDASTETFYALLTHPTLALRAALGPAALVGRGRWRRLLAPHRNARGLTRLLAALKGEATPTPTPTPTHTSTSAPTSTASDSDEARALRAQQAKEASELREQEVRVALLSTTTALQAALTTLAASGTIGDHARRWTAFLGRWVRPTEDRARLLAMLAPLTLHDAGPSLDVVEGRLELTTLLEREVSRGALTERSLRVLAPMHLLGGEFDVVCVLGLSERRFPSKGSEDALLGDDVMAALSTSLGVPLPDTKSHQALERRRFAAVVGATRQRLWLSVPAIDFATERPTLASPFVLDVASALLGRRVGYEALQTTAHLLVRRGSRARAFADVVDDSLDRAEHIVVRAAAGNDDAGTHDAILALASHAHARGLLQLHRSMAQAARGLGLGAWTGLVSPTVVTLRGLDGTPVPVATLVGLIRLPGDVAVRQLLQAFPLRRLSPQFGLLEPRHLTGLTEMAARHLLMPGGVDVTVDAVTTALVHAVWPELQADLARGAYSDGALERARPQVALLARKLAERLHDWWQAAPPLSSLSSSTSSTATATAATATAMLVDASLPWVLSAPVGRLLDDGNGQCTLVDLQRSIKVRSAAANALDTAIGTVAAATAGVDVSGLLVIEQGTGKTGRSSFDEASGVLPWLRLATTNAREGRFPLAHSTILRLGGDRSSENGAS